MNNTLRRGLSVAFAVAVAGSASAQIVTGGISMETGQISIYNQSNVPVGSLSLNDQFVFGLIPAFGANSFVSGENGDFTAVPLYSGINQSVLNIQNLPAYTWTSGFGSFTSSPITVGHTTFTDYAVLTTYGPGQTVLDVYEYGQFTPSGVLSSYTTADMVETISLTQTGNLTAVSCSATAMAIPEPSGLVALGIGLLGILSIRARGNSRR